MAYRTTNRIPDGIVFFGDATGDALFDASSSFTFDGSNLSVPNVILANSGTIGSVGAPTAIAIDSAGDVTFGADVSITGDLTVNGTTTTVNSTVVEVVDPIMVLGTGSPGVDDNKDRGIAFEWYSGGNKTGFFGFDDSTGKFTFVPDATISGEVVSGTAGVLVADLEGNADTATTLETARAFSLTGEVTSNSVNFNGSGNVQLDVDLHASAISGRTELTSVDANSDYLLIYEDGVGLKKVNGQNLIDSLNIVTSFSFSDGTTSIQLDQGETVLFSSGTGASLTVTDNGSGAPVITVDSVDSEIVHDNLSGFVANEHIDHSTVTLTAGAGLSGGGTIAASRTFDLDISEYSAVTPTNGDSLLTLDSNGSTEQLTTLAALATLFAGAGTTATNSVINVIGGDGITANANEVEVTVDNSTVELSASDGTGAVRVKAKGITSAQINRTIETVTSSKVADKDVTLVDATGGNVVITLPENGGTVGSGRTMVVKRTDSSTNTVSIARQTADTIDGSASSVQLYHTNESLTFVSNGADWFII